MKQGSIKVVVPARLGSKRVKVKNLRLLNGKPLIQYILDTLKSTKHLNNIYVNSDSDFYGEIAKQNGVKFYKRRPELATSESLIDDYLYDFMKNEPSDFLAMVCPTAPFVKAEELDNAWEYYCENSYDTLLSCERIQTHSFYEGQPINFNRNGQHPRSQDIKPVLALNFAICIWDTKKYIANYEAHKFGVYTGNLGFFEMKGNSNIDIDTEDDFIFAEQIAQFLTTERHYQPEYSPLVKSIIEANIDTSN